ncbi:MAG: transcriptional regulator GcvA [Pseudomonadota bacterium]
MKRTIPPPNWLRTFEAAARHLSFTEAATELAITPSAVSQQIRLLEQMLGVPLFHRLPKGLSLTPDGNAYLPAVADGFRLMAERTQEVFGTGRSRLVTVRVNAAFAYVWLAPRLKRFHAAHPEVELRLHLAVWLTEVEWDGLSLDIRYGNGHWPGHQLERLMREQLYPVCAPGTEGLATPSDLTGHLLLHTLGDEPGWSHWMAAAGVGELKPIGGPQFDSSALALEAAAAGAGVALAKDTLAAEYLRAGRLIRPFEPTIESDDGLFLVTPEGRVDSPETAAFRAWLKQEMAAY